jgi:hypothetical protein
MKLVINKIDGNLEAANICQIIRGIFSSASGQQCRASDAECGTALTALRDQPMCNVPVTTAGYWIGVGTGMLYSRATFSRTSLARTPEGRSPKSLATTLREWGQVVFPCGKSLDHMQLS